VSVNLNLVIPVLCAAYGSLFLLALLLVELYWKHYIEQLILSCIDLVLDHFKMCQFVQYVDGKVLLVTVIIKDVVDFPNPTVFVVWNNCMYRLFW